MNRENREYLSKQFPKKVGFPVSQKGSWNEFPLGVDLDGKEVTWDVRIDSNINILSVTRAGGKTNTIRGLIFHCAQYPDKWSIVATESNRIEMKMCAPESVFDQVATRPKYSVELLEEVEKEIRHRLNSMELAGVKDFQDLPHPPRAMLVIIDEMAALTDLGLMKVKDDVEDVEDIGDNNSKISSRVQNSVRNIARMGSAAGVHLSIVTQFPNPVPSSFDKEMDTLVSARYILGRAISVFSNRMLGTEKATEIPEFSFGRGIAFVGGKEHPVQGYFSHRKDIEKWLQENSAIDR